MAVAHLMLEAQQYRFSREAEEVFREYLVRRMRMPHFAHARSVRNALDHARLRQANRLLAQSGAITKRDLVTIEPENIRASLRLCVESLVWTNTLRELSHGRRSR